MDEKKLKALAAELAKGLKTEADLNQFSRMLTKLTVETALNAELTDHLGHEKNAPKSGSNTRNGYSSKTLLCDDGEIELNTPRDRENTFEPQLIKKNQTRITQMDSQILSLYAKGMTTREIVATFKEMYDADVSPTLISKVTDAVKEQVTEWQNRQLDALYPIVYMDCIVVKVRQNGSVINKAVFLALGINTEGQKELLGMWLAENEGAKFWLSVLTELKNRGLQDILIACVDGLKGFPDAINSVYPQPHIQLCIIHMVRNSLKYVSWKDYKAVTNGLKAVGPDRRGGADGAGCVRGQVGRQIPANQQKLACALGKSEHVLRLPAGYPQGHLHHECHRIAEQRDPCGDKETQSVPDGRLGSESCLSGDQRCLKKMEYANPELAMSRFIIEFGDHCLSDHL